MRTLKITIVNCFFLLFFVFGPGCMAYAQQPNAVYFIENAPLRHTLNPAFQPTSHFYLSLPLIGNTFLSAGNNSVSLHEMIYNYNGNTISFLDKTGGDVRKFYNSLAPTTVARADAHINLISAGYKDNKAFYSITVSEVFDTMVSLPKDLFNFIFFGTPDIHQNSFNLRKLQADATAYTEIAFGYAKQVNKNWMVGAKLKFLYGSANISVTNKKMKFDAGWDGLSLSGIGTVNYSSPMQLQLPNDMRPILLSKPDRLTDWVKKPSGIGAGIDLGVEYRLSSSIHLSAALTDFGFIQWYQNPQNLNYNIDYKYDGIENLENSAAIRSFLNSFNPLTTTTIVDSLLTSIRNGINTGISSNSYTTGTTAKLNIGAEYRLIEDKLSLGLLYRSYFFKNTITPEVSFSVNARPNENFNTSLGYSFLNGGFNSVGAGIGWRTGFVHWLVAADYIPFQKANLSLKDLNLMDSDLKIPIPYRTKSFNVSLGMNLVFDKMTGPTGLHKLKRKKSCNCNR